MTGTTLAGGELYTAFLGMIRDKSLEPPEIRES